MLIMLIDKSIVSQELFKTFETVLSGALSFFLARLSSLSGILSVVAEQIYSRGLSFGFTER